MGTNLSNVPTMRSQSQGFNAPSGHVRYTLIDLGTFGGPQSDLWQGNLNGGSQMLNNHGTLVGWADTSKPDPFPEFCFNNFASRFAPDCFLARAFQMQKGFVAPLNSLGYGSAAAESISDNGLISGIAQNGKTDPLIPGFPEIRAVLWENGRIIDLGTFGGNESLAGAVNDRGQVAGSALNTTPDHFSFLDAFIIGSSNVGTQTRAFLWQGGVMRDIGTLGGPDAAATYINERGQIAGVSYTSAVPNPETGIPPFHPFLWESGKIRDLGTLGGTQVPSLNALNDRGEVVGSMTLAGDTKAHPFVWDGQQLIDLGTFGGPGGDAASIDDAGEVVGWGGTTQPCAAEGGGQHPFLWKNGVKTDLGAVAGADNGDAISINSKTQIVGDSFNCSFTAVSAFLWEKGSIVDLNTLIPANSALHLYIPFNINDRGEIAGLGSLPNGDIHAFMLIPISENPLGIAQVAVAPRKVTAAEVAVMRARFDRRHFGFRRRPLSWWR